MPSTIYLDPDDVLGSIKTRIEQVGDARLTLVVPYGLRALRNPVALRLLRRYLESEGVRMTVVSRDPEVAQLARAEGLEVRRSEKAGVLGLDPDVVHSGKAYAAYQEEQAHHRKQSRIAVSAALAALALAVALPLSAAAMLLPSATVVLFPEMRVVEEVVQVRASTSAPRRDATYLAVPGEALQVEVETEEVVDLAGAVQLAARAQGSIVMSNRSTSTFDVRPGVRVGTANGKVYTIQAPLILLPGQDGVVSIVAEQPGTAGNAAAGTIDRLFDANLGPLAGVTNPLGIAGGRDRANPRVTDAHHQQLRDQATLAAREAGLRLLQEQKSPAQSFYHQSIVFKITREELDPPVGQEAMQATLRILGTARAVAFRGDEVNRALFKYIAQKVEGGQLVESAFDTSPLELVRWDGEEVDFSMRVKGLVAPRLEEDYLKELIKGRPVKEAEALLVEQVSFAGRPRIETEPFWSSGVPVFPWRINIRQGAQ